MQLRHALAALFTALALPAAAECVGDNYLDLMTPAQEAALTAAVADMPYAQGLIWRATKGDKTITLAGTMHVYDPRLEPIRDSLQDAVTSADLLLLEATPAEEAELQQMMIDQPDLLFINEGPTLPELLDEDTWQAVSQAVSDRGIPGFMVAKMQPWYVSMVLSIPVCAAGEMLAGQQGLDAMLIADATAAGVPMQALEPVTTLFDIFQDATLPEQLDFLRASLGNPGQQDAIFIATLDRYFARDVGRLWEMSRIALADVPGLTDAEATALFTETEQALLIDRNANWMPVINTAVAAHDDLVVAAGAAHLIAEFGLLQMLENDGWTLARLD